MPNAVILAAGRGTRLKSVTGDLPKPLLHLHGRPLLDYVLSNLRHAGFDRFLLVVGYRHELFYGRYAADTTVHYALQDPVDGTGSAALLARGFSADEPFLLTFGDILASPDDILALWQQLGDDSTAEGVLAVQHVDDPFQGAAVYEDSGLLTRIVEKPPLGTSKTNWNSAGIYAFRPAIFDELARLERSPRGEYELTTALVKWIEQGRRILVHPLQGEWRDVGRPEDVEAAAQLTGSRLP
ncbi:MAG: nucleotidyltransferase family protein [Acidobacteria bacterium]|nr:nucleotidyltransferase family protein [Acidobacteriota bacterium]